MRRRILAALALALLCSCGRRAPVPAGPDAGLSVTFFDAGQADAALLRTSGGQTVVIDTGRNGETASLLARAGVTRIDLLILSHPHADHAGGLGAILKAFPVAETWYAGEYRGRLRSTLRRAGRIEEVAAGTTRQLGRLSLVVLHPEPGRRGARGGESEVNNGSIVVKAVYGESRYLFPGDCELGCWEEMFKLHRPELRADVLKAAHHGSSNGTTSGVLINVRPRAVVISCGAGNRYGHPHSIVTRLVEKLRATLWRTDVHGAIHCAGAVCNSEP